MESCIFDFDKSPTFMMKWNKEFDVEEIATNCFYVVLVDNICDDNILDCLNADKQLRYSSEHLLMLQCSLSYTDDGDSSYITIAEDVTITFPYTDEHHTAIESFDMKGVFVTNDAGYVMGYSINTYSLNINTQFTIEEGLKLWSVLEAINNGE